MTRSERKPFVALWREKYLWLRYRDRKACEKNKNTLSQYKNTCIMKLSDNYMYCF